MSNPIHPQQSLRRKVVVTKEVHDQRLDICRECEHFKKTLKVCGICLCFMPAKTYLAREKCPLDPPKWDKETNKIEVIPMPDNEALPVGDFDDE